MNLHEQRAAAIANAKSIVDAAKNAVRDMTADEKKAFDVEIGKIDTLDAQIKEADADQARLTRLKSLTPEAQEPEETPSGDQAKSIGEHFVKHAAAALKSVNPGERFSVAAPEFKAPVTTSGVGQTQYGGVVQLPLQRPTVADLLLAGQMNGTALTYTVEGAVTGGPDVVAEGALKPELSGGFTQVTEGLTKIAGWSKESDELREDFAALASIVEARLLTRLSLREEQEILNGSGTGGHVRGLLNRSGIQTETQAATDDSAQDAIFRGLTKVQTISFLSADFVVINPADYQDLRLSRDANGQYFGGGFFAGQYGNGAIPAQPPLWGLNTVVTSAIAAKTVLVGSGQAAQVFRKGGVRVDVANTDQDDFVKNLITVRAEERILLAAYMPSALVKVTLQ